MLSCQKDKFSLPEGVHYLNCAYMSPMSKEVEAAGLEGIAGKRLPSVIKPNHFFDTVTQVKSSFGALVDAPASNIAVIPSASYGIATVAKNLEVKKDQKIIVVGEQFPSNVYSWMRLAESSGAKLEIVTPDASNNNRGQRWNAKVIDAISSNTAVVAMAHVHWADGTLFDLATIGARARDVGAAFIIDGTQSVGALPFNVDELKPDALVCAGYKWLLGPYSVGVAYYGPRFSDGIPLEENWITREGSENFGGLVEYKTTYQPGMDRFDVGEKSNFILMPMLLQALQHLHDWGVERIQQYCLTLTRSFCEEVKALGFSIEDEEWRAPHLFGVRVREDIPMERLMNAINEANISVSIRGTAVRISPNVYNEEQNIEALAETFRSVASSKTGHERIA